MKSHTRATKDRCNNAVSAAIPLCQRCTPTAAVLEPAKKTYRQSGVSRTVRVPNELVPRVNALIAAYRERLHDDPDTWGRN